MAAVGPKDAILYGLEILIYVGGFVLVGGTLVFVGVDQESSLGMVLMLVGFLITVGGLVGMQYKIIADGVRKGAHG